MLGTRQALTLPLDLSGLGGHFIFSSLGLPGGSLVEGSLPVQEMQEMWVWPLGWGNPLEKEAATCSSISAWKIPWTGESGRLQSMGLQRFGHD